MIAFLVADAAVGKGKQVPMFQQFADGGGALIVCPIYFNARKLDEGSPVADARLGGATPP